ncbi:MAG: family 2 glycosyl transferase [Bacteroidetes bacterium]|nr:family 2 glycosyl transferase [Bacteroidota bacterium]
MKSYENTKNETIKISEIKKKDVWTIRVLIGCGLGLMGIFVWWFISPAHIGYKPIFWLLTIALLFKMVKMLHEWYHYWSLSIPVRPELKTKYTVDILTTACPGEPQEMIIRTLRAMKEIRYPHTNYLCDEGNDPVLKKVCDELGIIHVTRIEKINAKAGNINNALKQATGDIAIVLDPDHVPVPEFIDRVLPYFEDPEIGFVQSVQAYGNQNESIIARGAAEQTYHFYGPMMMCMNTYGTVQAIGANCAFRRSALDSIGGHAAGLSEDMHTAMQLHAKGWKSIYIPEILTRGLVPATLSSYYKQQLKWSRGTFDLLFNTFPKLYKNFTWRQKIHYFTIPMYFLFGLINFIDILVPLLALSFAEVPWEVDLQNFGMFFIPLCGLSMIIRLFAQRWLLEKHERGFHLAGGILRTATWWIFLIGFIYAIFNIKVPYIPTPKEDEHQNYWQLSIPNFIIALICGIGIAYGLTLDWSPYSLAMAFYALINAGMLGLIVFMSQQKFLDNLQVKMSSVSLVSVLNKNIHVVADKTQHIIYGLLRNGPVALLLGSALLFLSYNSIDNEQETGSSIKQKDFGGFFTGITLDEKIDLKKINNTNVLFDNNSEIVSFKEPWDTTITINQNLPKIKGLKTMPMIIWQTPLINDEMWKGISSGKYDDYLERFAGTLRAFQDPVLINFSPGFDDNDGLTHTSNSPQEFIKAWQYIYTFFNDLGTSNVTWVWNPKYSTSTAFYPGPKFLDWIGVSCLNYEAALNAKNRYSFAQLYEPFRTSFSQFQKPYIITELGSVSSNQQGEWLSDAFRNIKEKYKEIHAAILFDQTKPKYINGKQYVSDFNLADNNTIVSIEKSMSASPFNKETFYDITSIAVQPDKKYHSKFITGNTGSFKLMIKGKPFYIKGVAYNTAHDWRDGNMPLTRRQVEKDMQKIKEMGANTIRRYDHGIYDKNVLNIAGEYNLNVLYGFWFDPKVDYYKDCEQVEEYMAGVEEMVREFKDHPSVLAWSLGNETWGLLKHNFNKPYLTKVRQSYVNMIELLAQRIHAIDPTRPVFSCMEHEEYQLPGELVAYHDAIPSVDVIGINSYYKEQISKLNHVFYQFDSTRPYVISEFGPRGYWDPKYNRTSRTLLVEDSEKEKADWYTEQWTKYVEGNAGYNIGGIAYCWHDRMEGTHTWFGLTDYSGRPKASYHALKKLWTGKDSKYTAGFCRIKAPDKIRPGEEFTFTAIVEGRDKEGLNYEWTLQKYEYLEKIDAISSTDNVSEARVMIPEKKATYRLYLHVSDESGNVATASVPIKVY